MEVEGSLCGACGNWFPSRHLVMPHFLLEALVWEVMGECVGKY